MSLNEDSYETDLALMKERHNTEFALMKERHLREIAQLEEIARLKEIARLNSSIGGHNGAQEGTSVVQDSTLWKVMHHPEWPGETGGVMDTDRILKTGEYYVNQNKSCPMKTLDAISPGDTILMRVKTTKGKNTEKLLVGVVKVKPMPCKPGQSPDPSGKWYMIHIDWDDREHPVPDKFSIFYKNTGQSSICEQTNDEYHFMNH